LIICYSYFRYLNLLQRCGRSNCKTVWTCPHCWL